MVRDGEGGTADEHQRRKVRPFLRQPLPVGEEPIRALVAIDAADIEHVPSPEAEARAQVDLAVPVGDVDPAAHHHRRHGGIAAHALHEAALLGREVDDPARAPEQVA